MYFPYGDPEEYENDYEELTPEELCRLQDDYSNEVPTAESRNR